MQNKSQNEHETRELPEHHYYNREFRAAHDTYRQGILIGQKKTLKTYENKETC